MAEEIGELKAAESSCETATEIEEEIGDLLFTVVNISRRHAVDPERPAARERQVHPEVRHVEGTFDTMKGDPKAMDALWNEIKEKEKKGNEPPFYSTFTTFEACGPFGPLTSRTRRLLLSSTF